MARMTKQALMKRDSKISTREVPVGDGDVLIRAVSREEVVDAREGGLEPTDSLYEARLVSTALVEPEMTPEEVMDWFKTAPAGDTVRVMNEVASLSGMDKVSSKSGVAGVRGPRKRR